MERMKLKIGLHSTDFKKGTGPGTYLAAIRKSLPEIHYLCDAVPGAARETDLVHLVDAKRAGIHEVKSMGVPVVADFHDDYWVTYTPWPGPDRPIRWARQKQLRRHHLDIISMAGAVVVHSHAVARTIGPEVEAVFEEKGTTAPEVFVVPYGIDPSLFEPGPPSGQADKTYVLFVGRDIFRKGFSTLVKAMPSIISQVPDAELVVIGDEYLHTSIAAKFMSRNLPVTFLPEMGREELNGWYKKASVLVLPSFQEAFGITLIEAMASNLPVVAADTGGIPEAVEDGISGLLHEPGNHEDLAEKTVSILLNEELRGDLIKGGAKRALAFPREIMIDALDRVYQSVMELS